MSADSCLVFYGLSFELSGDDLEACELRKDPRIQAARSVGLHHYWGAFGIDREQYLLFVGLLIGTFGPEHQLEAQYVPAALEAAFQETDQKLKNAGFQGDPKVFIRYMLDQ